MGLPRFYVARLATGALELDAAESSHASRVLRLKAGEDILLFDGLGNEGFATIQSIDRRSVLVQVASTRFAPRDHNGRMTLAVAMPKGDRQRNVIEKMVELGIDRLIPIETERSVAKVDQDAQSRLNRYMVEACKQSGRNRFLRMDASVNWQEFIREPFWATHSRWILHPCVRAQRAENLVFDRSESLAAPEKPLLFVIGPEGGFTDEEIESAAKLGFATLNLGERILRVETAVAFASVLGHLLTVKRSDGSPELQ